MTETEDYATTATPELHAKSHENDGLDEISVEALSGELADEQNAGKIKSKPVPAPGAGDDEKALVYDHDTGQFKYVTPGAAAHAESHENGGSDEVDVEGLSGELADAQPPKAHDLAGAEHNADTLADLNLKISDATLDDSGDPRTPSAHKTSHENEGTDEIDVEGLSGELADDQPPKAHDLAGDKHNADTLADLNLKVSDATLDDSGDPRTPSAHHASHEPGGSDEVLGHATTTIAAWSKTIGPTGDYATWAAAMAAMPDLLSHVVTLTIQKGVILTEICQLYNKTGLTNIAAILIQSEKHFPTSGSFPTATSGTATTLIDTGQSWAIDEFVDCWVFIGHGTGKDNGFVKITTNDATSLTVAGWTTTPDNTSRYVIIGSLIDAQSVRSRCLDIKDCFLPIIIKSIGSQNATGSNKMIRGGHTRIELHRCASYRANHSGLYTELVGGLIQLHYCAFVKNNLASEATHAGIRSSSTQYININGGYFNDNNSYGSYINSSSFAYIANTLGSGNGAWGAYCVNSSSIRHSGSQSTGTSGTVGDPGLAGTAGEDQSAAY